MLKTRPERTHFRDEAISERHREWGMCGAVDIDFLLNEYRAGYPHALIEYKHQNAALSKAVLNQDWTKTCEILNDGTYRALINLGDMAKLPTMACIYSNNLSSYVLYPLNERSRTYIPKLRVYSEMEYVQFLHDIRGLKMPDSLIEKIRSREKR